MNLIALIKERAKYYKCLACSQALADCDVRLLNESQAHCTVEVTCGRCGVSFVAVLLKRRKHPDGLPRTASAEPISDDELLDLHQQLKEHSGSLEQLFHNAP
jgi:hypothetical protein